MSVHNRLRGAAGLAGLIGAVVGVPLALAALGQAPPGGWPAWHQLVDGVQRPIADSTIVRAVALLCWLVWFVFAVAVAFELVGALMTARGQRAKPAWLHVPGFQGMARTLVLTAALVLPQRGPPGFAAAPARNMAAVTKAASLPTAARVGPDDDRVPATAPAAAPAAQAAAAARPHSPAPNGGRVRYVVQRYDSPWSIAERHLGHGTLWREIVDANGHRLDDGRHGGRPRVIHPGDVLLVPNQAGLNGSAPPAVGRHIPPTRAAHPLVGSHPSPAAATRPSADSRPSPVPSPAAPALPAPGPATAGPATGSSQPLVARPATGSSPLPAAGPATGSSPPLQAGPGPGSISSPVAAAVDAPTIEALPTRAVSRPAVVPALNHRQPRGAAAALLEAGLVGASVLGVVGALRQRQAQRRPLGRRIRLPGPELARCELAMRAGQTPDRARLVNRAMRFLAETLARSGGTPPEILGVVVDDDRVEVLLDRPAAAPAPWTSSGEGFRWRILAGDVAPGARCQASSVLPALTSVGRAAAGHADVLINLEAAGLITVVGQPPRAAGLLDAMATHLAGAPWAGAVDVVLVGLAPSLSLVDRVRTAPSITALHEELQATVSVMSETRAGHRCRDPFAGRVAGLAGDGWPPTIVFCARCPRPEEMAWLRDLARPGSGVGAVVAGPGDGAGWVIDVDSTPMPVDPLRLGVQPTVLATADMVDIGALLEIAQDDSGATLSDPPYDRIELSAELDRDTAAGGAELDRAAAAGAVGTAELGGAGGAGVPGEDGNGSVVAGAAPEPAGTDRGGSGHDHGSQPEATLAERLSRVNPPARQARPESEPVPELPDWDILVRVLGTVELEGAREFKRAKARELVVYLAMHPNGVGEAELDEALWPSSAGRVVAAPTRDSTVSVARTAVGGPARLLPAQGQGREKRYQLSDSVQSDWSRFCLLHRWARQHSSAAALRQALEMVRGRPFEGVVSGRTFGWIHLEGHARHIEAEVADAADLAAGLCLAGGDPVGARWAARRGLLADPYTERLWVRLMEAAHLLGESQEVERIMDDLDVVLELAGDFSGLHPITLAAYDRYSRRHSRRHG